MSLIGKTVISTNVHLTPHLYGYSDSDMKSFADLDSFENYDSYFDDSDLDKIRVLRFERDTGNGLIRRLEIHQCFGLEGAQLGVTEALMNQDFKQISFIKIDDKYLGDLTVSINEVSPNISFAYADIYLTTRYDGKNKKTKVYTPELSKIHTISLNFKNETYVIGFLKLLEIEFFKT